MVFTICLNCICLKLPLQNINKINKKLLPLSFTYTKLWPHSIKYYSTNQEKSQVKDISNVYYGVLTPQIKAVKVFSLATSITGCVAQPIIFKQSETIGSLPVLIAICSFVGFFTFVTPFLLHLITKKYVTHLEYNSSSDEYIATILNFFLVEKKISFTTDEVHVPDVPGMFTSFLVRGTPLFVDPRLFPNPQHYARIMGYDKPIDFKLKQPAEEKLETSKKS